MLILIIKIIKIQERRNNKIQFLLPDIIIIIMGLRNIKIQF